MERRFFQLAAALLLLASATASAQNPVPLYRNPPPRQGTIAGKLEELSRTLLGNNSAEPSAAASNNAAASASTSGPRTTTGSNRPTVGSSPHITNQTLTSPQYTASRPAAPASTASQTSGTDTSGAANSSRRTAQPGYRSSPTGTTAATAAPAAAPRQEPRTLQEALMSARRSPTASQPPVYNPPKTTTTAATAATKPTTAAPRAASEEKPAPLRSARRTQIVEETTENVETTEEPVEEEQPKPAPKAKLAASDALLVTQKSPALAVETSGPRKVSVGAEGRYKVAVQNTGDVAARDVEVWIELPEHAEVVGAEGSKGDARLPNDGEGKGLVWTIDQLAPRSREELTMRIVPRKNQSFGMAVQWSHAPAVAQMMVDVQEPRLMMALSGPKEVSYGEKAVFKLTFSNPGNADAENVIVKLLPIGANDGPMDSHNIGNIKAGDNKVVEMELIARQTGHLTIKAEANGAGGLRAYLNEEVLVRRADLKIDIEAPKFQYARTVVNYKVHVSNPGNSPATDIHVAAQMPARATYVSSTGGGQIDADGTRVVWNVRSLPAGEEQVLQFRCQLEAAGINRLQVVSTSGDLQHTASAITEVEALADLVLDVIEPEGAFPVGEEVSYEVRIKNRGTKSADGVDVLAFFSNGIEAVSATGGKHEIGAGKVTFQTLTNIGAGKEVTLKVKAKAQVAGNHVFRAEVYCKSLGTKLAEEGTTRFFGNSEEAAEEPTPTPAAAPAAERTGGLRSSSESRYGSGSSQGSSRSEPAEPTSSRSTTSRYRSVAPPVSVDETENNDSPLKPIPQERE